MVHVLSEKTEVKGKEYISGRRKERDARRRSVRTPRDEVTPVWKRPSL